MVAKIEQVTGPLPLTLRLFWELVGAVDFTGSYATIWPARHNPLQVISAADFFREVQCLQRDRFTEREWVPLAIDSCGDSYCIALPTEQWLDFEIEERTSDTTLIAYLRLALNWGGFPSFACFSNYPCPPEIAVLREGLLPI